MQGDASAPEETNMLPVAGPQPTWTYPNNSEHWSQRGGRISDTQDLKFKTAFSRLRALLFEKKSKKKQFRQKEFTPFSQLQYQASYVEISKSA